jgi:DNA-binding SARP family transcriptional activator
MLALDANRVVRVDDLVELLWRGRPPASAVTMVQGYISELRRLLEPGSEVRAPGEHVIRTGNGYRLRTEACQIDVDEFSRLAQAGHAAVDGGHPGRACELFEAALALCRGHTLGDIDVVQDHAAVTAVNIRRSEAVLRYADAAAMTGADRKALPHLRALCASQSLDEVACARLIAALAATGQRAEAAAVFEDIRLRLDKELGLRPGDELVAAYSRVLAAKVSLMRRF